MKMEKVFFLEKVEIETTATTERQTIDIMHLKKLGRKLVSKLVKKVKVTKEIKVDSLIKKLTHLSSRTHY